MASTAIGTYLGKVAGPTTAHGFYTCYVVSYDPEKTSGSQIYVTIIKSIWCLYSGSLTAGSGSVSWSSTLYPIGGTSDKVTYDGKTYYRSGKKTVSAYYEGGSTLKMSAWSKYTASSGTTYQSTLSKSITLPTGVTTHYTLTFDANGGTGTMADQTLTYGTSVSLPANGFKRSHYNFAGWIAWRESDSKYLFKTGTSSSAWYSDEDGKAAGYDYWVYTAGSSVGKQSSTDGDVVHMVTQWESDGSATSGQYRKINGSYHNVQRYRNINGTMHSIQRWRNVNGTWRQC